MPHKQKLNREKVQAALNTLCPKCGYSIPPAEIRRVDFDTMVCPKCAAAVEMALSLVTIRALEIGAVSS
jgi:ribosomal protein S27AE